MARRRGGGSGGAVLVVVFAPAIVAYLWRTAGILLVIASGLVLVGTVVARYRRDNTASAHDLEHTLPTVLVAVWCFGLSIAGLHCKSANDERVAAIDAKLVQERRAADEERTRAEAERKAVHARRAAEVNARIDQELNRPWNERAAEALARLSAAGEAEQENAVCYAAWLAQTAAEPSSLRSELERTTKRGERKVLAAARRDAYALRSVVCRDGTLSPSCMCGRSLRGCCSHHGGVAGCEQVETPTLHCPTLSDREQATLRLFGRTRADEVIAGSL